MQPGPIGTAMQAARPTIKMAKAGRSVDLTDVSRHLIGYTKDGDAPTRK